MLSASVSRPITLAGVQQYAAINYSLAALPSIQRAGEQRHSHINTTNGHIKTSSSPLSPSLSSFPAHTHTPIFFSSSPSSAFLFLFSPRVCLCPHPSQSGKQKLFFSIPLVSCVLFFTYGPYPSKVQRYHHWIGVP